MGRKRSAKRTPKKARSSNNSEIEDGLERPVVVAAKKERIRPTTNAARERSRVQNLKSAFQDLQRVLPNVPSGTKLSKLDVLLLATNYISHLMSKLSENHLEQHLSRLQSKDVLHPTKKWPMRRRLYLSDPGSNKNADENCVSIQRGRKDSLSDNTSETSPSIDDWSDGRTPTEACDGGGSTDNYFFAYPNSSSLPSAFYMANPNELLPWKQRDSFPALPSRNGQGLMTMTEDAMMSENDRRAAAGPNCASPVYLESFTYQNTILD